MPPGGTSPWCTAATNPGTTQTFQDYLEAASDGAWGKGTGRTFKGGAGKSGEGNEGTAATVKNTEGAITYNEWSFAQAQNLFHREDRDPGRPRSGGHHPGMRSGKTIAAAKVNCHGQ